MQNQVEYFALIISKKIIKTLSKKHVSFKKKAEEGASDITFNY